MERKRIIQLACEVGFCNLRNEHWDCHTEQIEAFAKLVAAHEREAIERVVGAAMLGADHELTKRVLVAIRARGNT
jgi:hypothetical protein